MTTLPADSVFGFRVRWMHETRNVWPLAGIGTCLLALTIAVTWWWQPSDAVPRWSGEPSASSMGGASALAVATGPQPRLEGESEEGPVMSPACGTSQWSGHLHGGLRQVNGAPKGWLILPLRVAMRVQRHRLPIGSPPIPPWPNFRRCRASSPVRMLNQNAAVTHHRRGLLNELRLTLAASRLSRQGVHNGTRYRYLLAVSGPAD